MAGRPSRIGRLTAAIALGFIFDLPASAGTAGEDDMIVSADPVRSDDLWDITIVSKVDELNISSVTVNRGNCRGMLQGSQLPHSLRFGESVRYRALFCHPIEVSVEANGQSEVFNFGASFEGKDVSVSADISGGFGYNNLLTMSFPCRPIEVTLTTDKGPITIQMK